jgi:exopolyphosphatase/guanosine-5'-triphosphate,3'-diphosphate pyrophosphatase
MLLAGVDIGTLTCRLLIAQVTPEGSLVERRSDRRILRLGEGTDRTGTLSQAAMARVVRTMRDWRAVVDAAHVEGETAVATSALREARNRDEFVAQVKHEAGFSVEVISGEEEARRTLLGIRAGLPSDVSRILGLDIGGGSTEFIVDIPGHVPRVRSIELGVVRLTERILHHDPPTAEEIRTARELVRASTEAVNPSLGLLSGTTFVGTAGSITTLAAMVQQLPAYQPARIHNYRLGLEAVYQLERDILSRTKAQRRGMPGLEPGREDVIAAGVLILRGVMETLGYADCLVSDYGLREGVLIDLATRLK